MNSKNHDPHEPGLDPADRDFPAGPLGPPRPGSTGGVYAAERPLEFEEEAEKGIADYVGIIYRRKWLVASVFIIAVAGTWIYAKTLIPVYLSQATIEIGPETQHAMKSVADAFMRDWMQSEEYTTQTEILKSRTLASIVANSITPQEFPQLFSPPKERISLNFLVKLVTSYFGQSATKEPPGKDEAPSKEGLINMLMASFSAKRQGESRLLRLEMESSDPVLARDLLQKYLDVYLEENLRKRRQAGQEANAWLKSELQRVEKQLVNSFAALTKFTNDHGMVTLDPGSSEALRFFNDAAEGLVRSKEQRVQLEAMVGSARDSDLSVLITNGRSGEIQKLQDKIFSLEADYSEMREIYSEEYPKMVLQRKKIDGMREKVIELEKNAVKSSLEAARKKEELRQKVFESAKQEAMGIKSVSVQYGVLKKEVETNEQVYRLLLQKSKELEVSTQTISNNINLIDRPTLPGGPIKPKKDSIFVVGALIGLVGGVLTALLVDHVDDKVRSAEDIEKNLSLPNLGVIPDIGLLKGYREFRKHLDGQNYEFLAYDAPKSPISEAVKNIKTSIFLSLPAVSINSIVVSSALPGEGKTFLAVSIATALSSKSKRVLVVDSDLRKPRIRDIFGEDGSSDGLTTLLTRNDVRLAKVIHRSRVPGLYYVPSGPPPPNPVALLESERMNHIINQFKEIFDVVIFDSPPVVGFSDARIIASHVDAVILVARQGHVPLPALREAKNLITTSHGKIMGVVLNMASGSTLAYGRYKHYRYYKYYKHYDSDAQDESASKA